MLLFFYGEFCRRRGPVDGCISLNLSAPSISPLLQGLAPALCNRPRSGWFALLYFASLLCFNLLTWIALLTLFALRYLTQQVSLDAVWLVSARLGSLASWHALDYIYDPWQKFGTQIYAKTVPFYEIIFTTPNLSSENPL